MIRPAVCPCLHIHIAILPHVNPNIHVFSKEIPHFFRNCKSDFEFTTQIFKPMFIRCYNRISFYPVTLILDVIAFIQFIDHHKILFILFNFIWVQNARHVIIFHPVGRIVQFKSGSRDDNHQRLISCPHPRSKDIINFRCFMCVIFVNNATLRVETIPCFASILGKRLDFRLSFWMLNFTICNPIFFLRLV
ncbi:hypothetical protein B4067_4814 [Bacillus subtilis subsp. subtilis]|uniref:Uncharacterized protein n=1 Tax=Bacillus subtilis subsp. subtilis TaxID=135461 RepID=A0ABD3ZQ21_BACIU|nr:hypothetical protein B4067_4814 [Bacillus subtilis subsp. subtilis]